MPLIKGKSEDSFKKNVATEYKAGHPLKQSLAIAYAMKRKAQNMADGGFVKEEEASGYEPCEVHGRSDCKMCYGEEMSDGGFIGEEESSGYHDMPEYHKKENEMAEHEDMDMIDRIISKRNMYSEGGKVANSDHGMDDDKLAGFEPNEFDDLTKDDDLEFNYTGANSGDEIGNHQEEEDQRDIVSRIMKQKMMKAGRYPGAIKVGL